MPPLLLNWIVVPGRVSEATVPDCRVFTCFSISLCDNRITRCSRGAIALFIVLAIVMYVTRKVDWYARDAS